MSAAALLNKPAPAFTAAAVVNGQITKVSLSDYAGKYVVLFFYPLDFTFVCPTEICAFSDRANEFSKIGAQLIGVSIDSEYSHLAWSNTSRKDGGLGGCSFPLVADLNKSIASAYGVLDTESGVAYRGLFIIDTKGNLRQITVNDLPVGRSVDEALRLVQAFQFVEQHGEVCPANWKPGAVSMKADPEGSKDYFQKL